MAVMWKGLLIKPSELLTLGSGTIDLLAVLVHLAFRLIDSPIEAGLSRVDGGVSALVSGSGFLVNGAPG